MSEIMDEVIVYVYEGLISFLPSLLVSIIIFLGFYVAARVFKKIANKFGDQADNDRRKVFQFVGSVLKTVIIIIGLITALENLGVDITAMVAALGLTGFALGFALKDALANLLAGILILFYHPFRCGDKIKVSGCEGVVTEIDLRYTKLDGGDKIFLVPNSTCFTNWIALEKTP